MERKFFTTEEELRKAIKDLGKNSPNTWLHLSNAAVQACKPDGLMVLKSTESDEWDKLSMIILDGETIRFDLTNPTEVLFFDMA